jgi:hypothetical protein
MGRYSRSPARLVLPANCDAHRHDPNGQFTSTLAVSHSADAKPSLPALHARYPARFCRSANARNPRAP